MLSKLNWPLTIVIAVVVASMTTLAALHIIPSNLIVAIVTGVVGWIVPSPLAPVPVPEVKP